MIRTEYWFEFAWNYRLIISCERDTFNDSVIILNNNIKDPNDDRMKAVFSIV